MMGSLKTKASKLKKMAAWYSVTSRCTCSPHVDSGHPHGYAGGMFSSQKEALTSSYETILWVTRGACTRANDLVHAAAEVMVRTKYSTPVYCTQHGAEVKPITRLSRKIHVKHWSTTFQDTRGAGTGWRHAVPSSHFLQLWGLRFQTSHHRREERHTSLDSWNKYLPDGHLKWRGEIWWEFPFKSTRCGPREYCLAWVKLRDVKTEASWIFLPISCFLTGRPSDHVLSHTVKRPWLMDSWYHASGIPSFHLRNQCFV